MWTLGTAGHVDHGKSTLVHALTGIHPDRWEEEQRREMTIDLGFAWLTTPAGRSISLVDVPGHERFIKNMLAGVGGLDAVLFIIAADEGIQPQTVEHLHIVDLLGIEHGVIVLTKSDVVDTEWLELMQEEVRDALQHSTLAHAPIIPVSARTGAGLDELKSTVDRVLEHVPARANLRGVPRLPIDRVFSVGGFGTVVTGTLLDGMIHVGDEIDIQPAGTRGRIRGIQTHQTKHEQAQAGSRVALNLAGIERTAIKRGDVLSMPDALQPTSMIDVQLRLTNSAPTLKHNDPLDLFVGAAEVSCFAALLDRDQLNAGETGWVQLRLDHVIAVQRGDRCIVRRASPSLTIGGGVILDAHPARHRRFREHVVQSLTTLARGTPRELLEQPLSDGAIHEWRDVVKQSGLDNDQALAVLAESNQIIMLDPNQTTPQTNSLLISQAGWKDLATSVERLLADFHARYPLRSGMNREEVRSRLKLNATVFNVVLNRLIHEQSIMLDAGFVRRHDFMPQPSMAQQHQIERLLRLWHDQPTTPPSKEAWTTLDPELWNWIIQRGALIKVGQEVYFLPETYAAMRNWIEQQFAADQAVTLAGFRDAWNTTRKYAQAFLEHLDELKVTRRVGDVRVKG